MQGFQRIGGKILMNSAKQTCVFGPIPSRRLGLSLGVDLVPFKTCSMDCIYCECGKTTSLTLERREYFPTDLALAQIDAVLNRHPQIDYITFSGTGEPTLHSGIGRVIAEIKAKHPEVKVCLLTNASLLTDPAVRRECAPVDLIVPSLDGSNEEEFEAVNRPAKGVTLRSVAEGIAEFRKISSAQMWLELFIAKDINDSEASAKRFLELVRKIRPDKVQLNTLDRPGTERDVGIPPRERLEAMARIIGAAAPVECVGGRAGGEDGKNNGSIGDCNDRIVATCASRPCTAEDLARSLGFRRSELETHLRRMEKAGLVFREDGPRGIYYRAGKPS